MPETRTLSYAQAVNAALARALEEYPESLLFGEDIALPGGVFGVTKGLQRRFGDRVFDTPISEAAILGGAVGAAMAGRRPIVEIMWADFSLVALDQLVNQAANVRCVSRGRLTAPMTVRTQQGNAPGACAQHSQSLEALFAHVPGLQVCMPATTQDAYDMLLSAVATEDPTIVIENRTLYHGAKTAVEVGGLVPPIGVSATRRTGDDVTVVTWGSIQNKVLQAAEQLANRGHRPALAPAARRGGGAGECTQNRASGGGPRGAHRGWLRRRDRVPGGGVRGAALEPAGPDRDTGRTYPGGRGARRSNHPIRRANRGGDRPLGRPTVAPALVPAD
jgi:pyruvate/2-oxoglutarate/acetoin dehydrogenase E1 component